MTILVKVVVMAVVMIVDCEFEIDICVDSCDMILLPTMLIVNEIRLGIMTVENVLISIMLVVLAVTNTTEILLTMVIVTIFMMMALVTVV
jgi:hypothetical protein